MRNRKDRVCPVEMAGSLDTRMRRWIQNPRKILSPYIKEGMTVLDFGCGPGYFTLDMAKMVGNSGRVIAVDLQEGMLQKLRDKIQDTDLEGLIELHLCEADKIGLSEKVDFVLAFYVIHELTNLEAFFKEMAYVVNSGGMILVVEPPFHVSKPAFLKMIKIAGENGFSPQTGPRMFLNKTLVLKMIRATGPEQ